MRLNVYSQELTDEVKLISKMSDTGTLYHGIQFMLHSSDRLHHTVGDDDRSAVTFWLPKSSKRRKIMAETFEEAAKMFRNAPNETGVD